MRIRRIVSFLVTSIFVAMNAQTATVFVPADKPTIQEGIDIASTGDTVLVSSGTYTGALNTNLDFYGKSIVLLSQSGAATTIIDCENIEFRRGIYLHSGEDSLTKIEGFTIKRGAHRGAGVYCVGSSVTIDNCIFSAHYSYHGGAAIRCDSGANIVIRNSTLSYNYSGIKEKSHGKGHDGSEAAFSSSPFGQGGALCVDSGSTAILTSCTFRYNTCDEMGGAAYVRFGGIIADSCTFTGNSVFGSSTGGGALFVDSGGGATIVSNTTFHHNHAGEANGGAIFVRNSSPVFLQCVIDSNNCWFGNGGAVCVVSAGAPQFNNCDFYLNHNESGCGGAVYASGSHAEFSFCIIRDSYCGPFGLNGGGGAICADSGSAPLFDHCTVVRNYTTDGLPGAALLSRASSPTLAASIVAFNGDGDAVSGQATVSCTNIWGNAGGDWTDVIASQRNVSNNLCAPPRFCDTANADFRIASNSRCASAHNPCAITMGALSQLCADRPEGLHVSVDGDDLTGCGSSAYPFATIQKGIDASQDFDSVLIHSGSYSGIGNTMITTNGKKCVVYGLSGQQSTSIALAPGETGFVDTTVTLSATIDGLTIAGGNRGIDANADGMIIRNCVFEGVQSAIHLRTVDSTRLEFIQIFHCDSGIAFLPSDSLSLGIYSCAFESNGVGIKATDISGSQWSCVVTQSSFDSCMVALDASGSVTNSTFSDCGTATAGTYPSVVTFDSCTMARCTGNAIAVGTAVSIHRSAIENCLDTIVSLTNVSSPQSLTIEHSVIRGNNGGIHASGRGPLIRVIGTEISGNIGGIEFTEGDSGKLVIDSSTIAQNTQGIRTTSNISMIRSIIAFNGDTGIVITPGDSVPVLQCNNIFGNIDAELGGISDPVGVDGNISSDPLFCDTSLGELTLLNTSVCLPAGNSCAQRIGARGAGCAYPVVDSIRVDIAGNNMHVLSETPLIQWHRGDSLGGVQTSFEIAIGIDSNWVFSELWNPAPYYSADSTLAYAGAPLSDGLSGWIRLRIVAGGRQSQWKEIPFRLNSIPTTPAVLKPSSDSIVMDVSPIFWITGGADNDGDSIYYEVQIAADSQFVGIHAWDSLIAQKPDSTDHESNVDLPENTRCYVRARSHDRFEHSLWSERESFRVNAVEESPARVQALLPPDSVGRPVFDMQPWFSWLPSTDPDPGDSISHYRIAVSISPQFTFSLIADSLNATSWQMIDSLFFSKEYWWYIQACDTKGNVSLPSDTQVFWTWTLGDLNDSHTCNVVDLTRLVSFLFQGGAPLSPHFIGDVNGTCQVNVVDITYLVNYLFKAGASPVIGCGPSQ